MKIRNGFVSNSSTSSFIINPNENLQTVSDVAKYILNVLFEDFNKHQNTSPEYLKKLKTLEKKLENIEDPNTPVNFNSAGDETYIRKEEDKIVILTTQNIDFPLIRKHALKKKDLNINFYKKFDHVNEYKEKIKPRRPDEFYQYYEKFYDFLILEHEFYGRTTYVDNCTCCHRGISSGWILKNGKVFCSCQLDNILAMINRRKKLEQINKQIK